jgi:hypothetical protein
MIAPSEAPSNLTQLSFFNLPVSHEASRFDKMKHTRKANTCGRNERIRARFNYLYNQERKRIDDVISILCEEFSLAKSTIEKALKG